MIHVPERGYGAALKTGFAAASHDLVGFLDGDATYPPEQFPNLCREIMEDRADLVIGSRLAGAETEMPLIRRLGNLFFARLLTIVGRAAVTDSASGMRVFRKATLELLSPLPDGLIRDSLKYIGVPAWNLVREHIKVTQLRAKGRLTPALILRALCMGEIRFFEAAAAELAGIPFENAQVLARDPAPGPSEPNQIDKKAGVVSTIEHRLRD